MENNNGESHKIEELAQIYETQANLQIMGPDKSNKRKNILKLFAFVAVIISLVGWLTFFIISNIEAKPDGRLNFSIVAPERAVPGGSITYKINIKNEDTAKVKNAHIRLNYPDGFVYRNASTEPEEGPNNSWAIDTIYPGDSVTIDVEGALLGDSDAPRIIFGVINYELEGFRSRLELTDSQTTFLGDEIITVNLTGSQNLKAGDPGSFIVTVENLGDEKLFDLDVDLIFSEPASNVGEVSPDASEINSDGARWSVSELSPGEKLNFDLSAIWDSSEISDIELTAKVQSVALSGIRYTLAEDSYSSKIEQPELTTNLLINDKRTTSATLDGSNVVITMQVINNSDQDIPLNNFTLSLDSSVVDWENASLNGAQRIEDQLIWTSEALNDDLLSPTEEKILTWIMPVLSTVSADTQVNFVFTVN